ncbi:tyrosine-type recombinase/integrase [Gandjariella thermophila]|uniref:Tyr recombinase domain-containing protein n=1 Tax=Gandjariella thermophila TaxID=1931992 RepID=A0A4D4J1W8_9PSEU|nr:site-specific integrase [Gandjariella thermophila]GDY28778.1 hypothetical protein GTS_04110 [Gandjariella thermophila]
MGHIVQTPAGSWRANWREPSGRQRSKTFKTKREARAFLAQVETAKTRGEYVSPHGGRTLFRDHADRWMKARRTEITTAARDASVMRTHVLPQWGDWPLAKIDELSVQTWITELAGRRSQPVVAKCLQLTSAVMRSAVRNKLIGTNPCEGVTLPKLRKRDTDERIISRADLRARLLPAVPERYRAVVAAAAGAGLRWGEVVGLCTDAVDLDAGYLRVVRTVVEVAGNTSIKPYPKSSAGRRTVPLPSWVVEVIYEHLTRFPVTDGALLFTNLAGGALRRTLFRSRVWRPALVRAGLLGRVTATEADTWRGEWTAEDGTAAAKDFTSETEAIKVVAREAAGGLRFHDLRHSYATWLVDDGVPVNMVQRVLGHERSSTTLDLYTRRTDDGGRILRALGDADEDGPDDDPDESAGGALTSR